MTLTKKQRKIVFEKSDGLCWYCGCTLPKKGWHADHMKPVIRSPSAASVKTINPFGEVPENIKNLIKNNSMGKPQNDTIDNIVPACAPCNLFKNVLSVEEFRAEIQQQVCRGRKTSVNFRMAEKFGLIEVKVKPIKFWFEKEGENK